MANDALTAVRDPKETLATFDFQMLARFTREGTFDTDSDPRYRLFFVGRDDVHGILKYLISRCSLSLRFNMFGYDDDELDAVIHTLVGDPNVYVQGTLDKSQAGGVHEKQLLAGWDQAAFAQSFAVGNSATHQISHTKGGVLDGSVAFEGSTNWSVSGEGQHVPGQSYKAQNNTLLVTTDRVLCARFSAQLDAEHHVVLQQAVTK